MSIASPAPRRQLSPAQIVMRVAGGPVDAAAVRELDNAAFPPTSADQERAYPGELEDGVAAGDVYLLQRDDAPVAYLHVDRQRPGQVYIAGLAVHPNVQGGGLGKLLIDHFLTEMQDQWLTTAIVTVTSPRNYVMLSLLFDRGFAGRWLLRDFFGTGRHRLACQLPVTRQSGYEPMRLTSASQLDASLELMEREGCVVRGLVRTSAGPQFLISPVQLGEFLDCQVIGRKSVR